MTVEIDRAQYPYHFENGEVVFDGEGWAHGFSEGVIEIDPATGSPAYLSGDSMGLGITKHLGAEEAGGNLPQPAIGRITVLANQAHTGFLVHRQRPGAAGVTNDLQRFPLSVGKHHAFFLQRKGPSLIDKRVVRSHAGDSAYQADGRRSLMVMILFLLLI